MVERLLEINDSKWWWYELALIARIRLKPYEDKTPRALLEDVVDYARKFAAANNKDFVCEHQPFGTQGWKGEAGGLVSAFGGPSARGQNGRGQRSARRGPQGQFGVPCVFRE